MRREVCRNRQRDAAVDGRVTAIATLRRPRFAFHVLRVIELHVEAFIESRGKTLERRVAAFCICVTDETHRDRRRRELSAVTISAGFVTGETRSRGVVSAFVTGRAGEGTMSLAGVKKPGVIDLGSLRGRGHTKSERRKRNTDDPDLICHLRFIGGRSAIR
jgi:hypothetical protein